MAKLSYLDLSTGHLAPKDRKLLEQGVQATVAREYEYGWFLPVYDGVLERIDDSNAEADETHRHTPAFRRLYEYAIEQGVTLICLDADGPTDENLEFFEENL